MISVERKNYSDDIKRSGHKIRIIKKHAEVLYNGEIIPIYKPDNATTDGNLKKMEAFGGEQNDIVK